MTTEPWHLDRRVPVALIVTILMQTMAAVWWASGQTAETADLRRTTDSIQQRLDAMTQIQNAQAVAAARTEQDLRAIREGLTQMRADLRETNDLLRRMYQTGGTTR